MDPRELFALELARLWIEERVSCPHRNLLQAFLEGGGSMDEGAREFVAFHTEEVGCPACRVELDDLREPAAPPAASAPPAAPPPPAGTAKRLLTETQLRERAPRPPK